MPQLWKSAFVSSEKPIGRVLVHGPAGFLVSAEGLLFNYEWVNALQFESEAHGIGFLGDESVHLVATDSSTPVPGCTWQSLRPLMLELDLETFRMLGYAAQIATWSRQHRFCGACGLSTKRLSDERASYCAPCDLRYYPRNSPCMIVLITHGDEVLLARSPGFPPGLYSTLAGFVEPGESMEECVIREVREEVGIEVTNIQYITSQSWPYPHSMMIGFHAEYASGDIVLEEREIEDARWFHLDELPTLSSQRSISRYLIELYRTRRSL